MDVKNLTMLELQNYSDKFIEEQNRRLNNHLSRDKVYEKDSLQDKGVKMIQRFFDTCNRYSYVVDPYSLKIDHRINGTGFVGTYRTKNVNLKFRDYGPGSNDYDMSADICGTIDNVFYGERG